jgi:GAF domain-containing protein
LASTIGESEELLRAYARALQATSHPQELLQRIVDGAVAAIDACDYAGLSVDRSGRPTSPAVSDPAVETIDELQYAANDGPCLDTMRGVHDVVDAPDLRQDDRWGEFGPRAAAEGVKSLLAQGLYVNSHRLGSLNLYAAEPGAFGDEDRRRAAVVAALGSLAMNALRFEGDAAGLREALRSRDVIGQAKGILMERLGIDEDAAFDQLRLISQRENRKLREVADEVARTHRRES